MRGHVCKKGNKWYFVLDTGRDPETGKRKQKWFSSFKTKKAAERAMTEKIHELNRGTFVEPKKITIESYLEYWLNNYAKMNCAPRTLEWYEYLIEKHLSPSLGKITLDQLKPMHIQKYYSEKLKNGRTDGTGGLSTKSVLHHHRLLHEVLEHAIMWQFIPTNPAKAVAPPKLQKKQLNVLDKEQIQLLLQTAGGKWYYYPVFLAINTGMRRGEILGLRWQDVDFGKQTISIHRTVQRIKEIGLAFRNTTKTDSGRRSIAVSNSVIDMLKKIKVNQEKQKFQVGSLYQDHELVFSNEIGQPIDPSRLSREFAKLVRRIEIPHVRFHDLRHCHATLLLRQGEHPKVVSERLGHSTIAITMDTYSHVMPNMQKEAARKLDDFLFGDRNNNFSE